LYTQSADDSARQWRAPDLGGRDKLSVMVEPEAKRKCDTCGAEAPNTETDYTLIGSKHAWRCKKKLVALETEPRLTWYCPSCWKNVRPESRK
jgi:hypothetical protein